MPQRISIEFPASCSFALMDSPVGSLMLIASDQGLHAVLWESDFKTQSSRKMFKSMRENARHPVISRARRQLGEYFSGDRKKFDLPLVPIGSPFQKRAWNLLQRIPYGETLSYQEQAKALGDAKKVRAVASANGKNPLCIIIPCHRVIAKSGALSGYAGGISKKKFLLELEQGTDKSC